jgi:hypothetical protein
MKLRRRFLTGDTTLGERVLETRADIFERSGLEFD